MFIETCKGQGKGLKITGRCGNVMKESVEIAYTYAKYYTN